MISIVIPIYNESKNISVLFSLLHESLINYSYEIIAVNDGSVDSSWEELKKTAIDNSCVKLINFKRNFGQTAAINAGIQFAKGDIIVLIDSDLENDPNDIKNLLNVLEKGYDVVSGWRKDRWEGKFLSRKLPSIIAKTWISSVFS